MYIYRNISRLMCGGVAQMVERSLSMREVPGSMPGTSRLPFVSFTLLNVIHNKQRKLISFKYFPLLTKQFLHYLRFTQQFSTKVEKQKNFYYLHQFCFYQKFIIKIILFSNITKPYAFHLSSSKSKQMKISIQYLHHVFKNLIGFKRVQ